MESLIIYFHLFTYHFRYQQHYNKYTYGIGVSYKEKVNIGYYKNSIYKDSYYISYKTDFNFVIGVATGYKNKTLLPKYKMWKSPFPNKYNILPIIGYDLKIKEHFHFLITPTFITTIISF